MEASEMAFTTQQKREWRNKPEVRDRQAAYKREWDVANRHERAEYQRAYRARRASAGALKGAGLSDQQPRTSGHDSAAAQTELFGDTNN
jgi:hypothetical protein